MAKLTVGEKKIVKHEKHWLEITNDEVIKWLKDKIEVMHAIAATLPEHEFQAMRYEARIYELGVAAIIDIDRISEENKHLKAQIEDRVENFVADRLIEIADDIKNGRYVVQNHDCY